MANLTEFEVGLQVTSLHVIHPTWGFKEQREGPVTIL